MFRRFTSRTPDRSSKSSSSTRSKSKATLRDPPTAYGSSSTHSSSSTQNETSSHSEEKNPHDTTMRRSNYPRSFDHRSTTSSSYTTSTATNDNRLRQYPPRPSDNRSNVSSAHTTTTTNEDRERLRNFLKGAMAGSQNAPPDHKQALMERVLKRSKTMDKKVPEMKASEPRVPEPRAPEPKAPEPKAPDFPSSASSLASTTQSRSNFEADRVASTSTRLTPQALQQAASAPSLGRRLESVNANPSAMEFRNRLRKITTQQQPQQESTSLLDVKTREMIQHRFRQRHAVVTVPVAAPPKLTTRDIIMPEQEEKYDDPDLEGYDAFFQTLQDEVHGQHSLLWASFSAVMKNERPPELEAVPPTKSFRFDKRTKEMLTMMNAYMQEKPYVVHVPATQLVNDKKFSKEWKKNHTEESTKPVLPTNEPNEVPKPPSLELKKGNKDHPIDLVPTASTASSSSTTPRDRYMTASKMESASLPSTTAAVASSMDFENTSNPGVEVTLGQFEFKVDSKLPHTPSDVSGAPTWTNVQLRSVRPSNADEASKSKTPNFAKVQLRKVSPPPEVKRPFLPTEIEEEPADEPVESTETKTSRPAVVTSQESEGTPDPPAKPPPQKNSAPQTTKEMAPKKPEPEPKKIDEAVYVNLKPGPDDKEGDQSKVIVGRKNIMIVTAKNGDEQAHVLWKLSRSDAASLTIDMTQLLVKLIDRDGAVLRELKFDNSGDCLKFANAFYEKVANETPAKLVKEEAKAEVPKAVLEAADDDGDTEFAAVRLERLNDEEQAVLDTYRRLRRSKPPRDALAESVSKETASTVTGKSLSAEEETVASKYRKMLKLRIPAEAVQHSMEKDEIADHIMHAVLADVRGVPKVLETDGLPSSPVSTFSTTVSLSDSDAAIVERFKKMLKMGIPMDGVRHKLMKEGIDTKLQEFILEGPGDSNKSPTNSLSPADEEVAGKYRKMISMGIPKDAVRHEMAKGNVPRHIVASVLGDSNEPDHLAAETPPPKKDKGLTPEEDKIAAEFKKLLKRQIPRQTILDRMKTEGVSEKVVVAVLGKRGLNVSTKDDSSHSKGNSSRFVQIHWTPLSGSQLDNSVWNATKNRSVDVAAPEGTAFSKLKELFEKKTNPNLPKASSSKKESDGPSKAKLLDINRSNNVAISLKAFKDYSYPELSDIIKFLDPLRKLHGDRVHFLRDLLPTMSETKLVQSYDGPDSRLEPAELWFKSIVGIKRTEAKVHVLRTMELLETESRTIGENLRLLTKVCNQVMDSERLQDLLVMVLQIGNIMNEGTRTGRAAGFKLDSLLKLTQTKSADGKTTVLDYLVEDVFIAKGQRQKLDLTSDFPECSTAGRMLIGDLVAEVKAMQDSLSQCKDELEALRKEASKKNGGVNSAVAKIESQEKNNIYGAIERLESFIVSAEDIVESLIKDKDEALTASRELSKYCGEGSATTSATSLLKVLSEFATNIESAVRKSDEKRKARERREKRQNEDAQSTKSSDPKGLTNGKGESLVLLVNKMLKDANPRTIEDFKKGRVLHNPSHLMKSIYEKEQIGCGRPSDRGRASLATAIQEKSEDLDEGEFLTARNKFGSPRTNMMAKRAETAASARNTPPRAPPVPWSPPTHRDVANASPVSTAVATDHSDESGSLVTDTSIATTTYTDAPVENHEHDTARRPVTRPTPEGMPLRDHKDTGVNRRPNTRPSPEDGFRDANKAKPSQFKPTPETGFRRTTRVETAVNADSVSIGSGPKEDDAQSKKSQSEPPQIKRTTSSEAKGGHTSPAQDSTHELVNEISARIAALKDGRWTKNGEPDKDALTASSSSSQITSTAEVTEDKSKELPFRSPGQVSALAAAFSKPNSVPIQPAHPKPYSSTVSKKSIKTTPPDLQPSRHEKAESAIPESTIENNRSSHSSEGSDKNQKTEASAAEVPETANNTGTAQKDAEETFSNTTVEPTPTFQYIRNRLDGKNVEPPSPEPRPDPPSETKASPSSCGSRPDPPSPIGDTDASHSEKQVDPPKKKESPRPFRSAFSVKAVLSRVSHGKKPVTSLAETTKGNPEPVVSVDNTEPQKAISSGMEQSGPVENKDASPGNIFDISAARGRIAARKSIETSRTSILSPDVSVEGGGSGRDSCRQSMGSIGKKQTKSLQELAMLKREKRSTEKSPMKKPSKPSISESAAPEELPSLTGYLEMARQRRMSASSPPLQKASVSSPQPVSVPSTTLQPKDTGKAASGESSFSKLAREKRAARKGR